MFPEAYLSTSAKTQSPGIRPPYIGGVASCCRTAFSRRQPCLPAGPRVPTGFPAGI